MIIALVLFTVFKQFETREPTNGGVTYTQFMQDAREGRISNVDIQGDVLHVRPQNGRPYTLTSPGDIWMVSDLLEAGVQVSGKQREEPSLLMSIFVSWFPMLLL
ncbi:MAG: ATP-dependent metallopeptidase FtsH/Yme1/Tma family protein, partial [Pigmentiphaga sp.]